MKAHWAEGRKGCSKAYALLSRYALMAWVTGIAPIGGLFNGMVRALSIFCLLMLALWPPSSFNGAALAADEACGQARALIILSNTHPSYEECADGIEQFLRSYSALVPERMTLGEAQAMGPGQARRYSLVLPVGSDATEFAVERFSKVPVVFSMVLDPPGEFLSRPNVYGICLDLPVSRYISWFREIIPGFSTLGVLYTESSLHKVQEMRQQARAAGVRFVALRVDNLAELPARLDELSARVQALLALPDELLYNRVIAPRIIYYCIKNRLPFAGLSANFTRAGALFSLDVDYKRLGRKAARIAVSILRGGRPKRHLEYPDSLIPHLNLRTAKLIGLQLDARLISKFKVVVQ
jgi:putative ABC transport system substrate-binding protein